MIAGSGALLWMVIYIGGMPSEVTGPYFSSFHHCVHMVRASVIAEKFDLTEDGAEIGHIRIACEYHSHLPYPKV